MKAAPFLTSEGWKWVDVCDLCEIEGMLETYHSNYKIDYFSIKLKVFSRCTTKSFFSFYKNSSFSSSLPLLSPSIHWNCTGQDTFLPSSAFQRCSICVCVGPRLWAVWAARQQRSTFIKSQATVTLLRLLTSQHLPTQTTKPDLLCYWRACTTDANQISSSRHLCVSV